LVDAAVERSTSDGHKRITIHYDNLSNIQLAKNLVFHVRTKHIEVHYHLVREYVLNDDVNLRHIRTDQQVANIFTMALGVDKLRKFSEMMGLHHLDMPSLRESVRQDGAVARRQWIIKRENTQKHDEKVIAEKNAEKISQTSITQKMCIRRNTVAEKNGLTNWSSGPS
jgi:hypothetical protein